MPSLPPWHAGTQDLSVLAWQFQVSQQAMQIRLENLGLIVRQPRRYRTPSAYCVARAAVQSSGRHYHRSNRPNALNADPLHGPVSSDVRHRPATAIVEGAAA